MKTSVWLAALMLTAALSSAFAQELAKFRYRCHSSYSTNNYKQPARVALSIKVGRDRGQAIFLTEAKRANRVVLNRNYKQQFPVFAHLIYQPMQPKTPLKPKHRIGEKGKNYEYRIV